MSSGYAARGGVVHEAGCKHRRICCINLKGVEMEGVVVLQKTKRNDWQLLLLEEMQSLWFGDSLLRTGVNLRCHMNIPVYLLLASHLQENFMKLIWASFPRVPI